MLSLVHVDDHQITHIQVQSQQGVGNFALEDHAEAVDGGPHEVVLIDVSLIVLEPGVEGGGVLVDSDAGEADGCRSHQGADLADGVGRGSQLLVLPLGVALVVLGVVA